MKSLLLSLCLLMLSGCVVVSRDSTTYSRKPPKADGPNAGTIHGATHLGYMSDRARLLKDVAGRDNLTDSEQLLIIDAAARTELYLSDRSDILLTLAKNPRFAPCARNTLGEDLHQIDLYESDRVRIVEAMDASARGLRP